MGRIYGDSPNTGLNQMVEPIPFKRKKDLLTIIMQSRSVDRNSRSLRDRYSQTLTPRVPCDEGCVFLTVFWNMNHLQIDEHGISSKSEGKLQRGTFEGSRSRYCVCISSRHCYGLKDILR